MTYALGKHAIAICDRCGFEYPYLQLQEEWNGLRVCPICFEEKHPQLEPIEVGVDNQALYDPRPARVEPLIVNVGQQIFTPQGIATSPLRINMGIGGVEVGTEFSFPLTDNNLQASGIAIDSQDRFFVISSVRSTVYGFNSDGSYNPSLNFNAERSRGQVGITIDPQDRFFIVNAVDTQVYGYNADRTYNPSLNFDLDSVNPTPRGIAIDSQGRFFVVDIGRNTIVGYNADGTYNPNLGFSILPSDLGNGIIVDSQGRFFVIQSGIGPHEVFGFTSEGINDPSLNFNLPPTFRGPSGMAIDSQGRFFIAFATINRAYRFNPDGSTS